MFTPGNQPVDSYCGKREIRIESIFSGFHQRSPLIYSFGNAHACKSICHCAAFLVPEHLGLSLSHGCAGPESFCPPSLVVGRVTQGATCTPSQHPPTPQGLRGGWCLWLKQSPLQCDRMPVPATRVTLWSILMKLLRVSAGPCHPGWSSWWYVLQRKMPLFCLSFTYSALTCLLGKNASNYTH